MKRMTMLVAGAVIASGLALSGCDSSKKTTSASDSSKVSMAAMNDKCPISGMAVNKSAKTASFEGHTVGFCCNNCQAKWDAMSKADKEAWMAKNMNMSK